MGLTWWERLQRWVCERFGHRVVRDEHGTETCARCYRLLSTRYSRSREAGHG